MGHMDAHNLHQIYLYKLRTCKNCNKQYREIDNHNELCKSGGCCKPKSFSFFSSSCKKMK